MKKELRRTAGLLLAFILTAAIFSGCEAKNTSNGEQPTLANAAVDVKIKEQIKLIEQKRLEDQKKAEEQRKLEEQKKLEDQKKLEEQKKAEEQKKLAEKNKQEEQKKAAVNSAPASGSDTDAIVKADSSLGDKLKKYLGSNISKVGLVYYDLSSGEKVAINENNVFLAASTLKVQMNMIAYDKAARGELSLDKQLQYNSSYYESGTGILQGMDKSKPFPVQMLLDYAIIYSDNIATNMILHELGGGTNVRKLTNSMVGTNVNPNGNNVSPEEEFRVLKRLYEGKGNPHYAHLIGIMKKTVFHDRLDKYVPQSIVAHKIGNYGSYTNDVGIIFTDKPYILVVYTNGLSGAADKIAQISKIVYQCQLRK